MHAFISSYIFQLYLLQLLGFGAFFLAIIVGIIASLEISEKWWWAFLPNYKYILFRARYLKPFLILLMVIIITEGMIFIYKVVS